MDIEATSPTELYCLSRQSPISFSTALLFLRDWTSTSKTFTIYGAPQIHIPTLYRDEHFIEMPACVCGWMRSSELSGIAEAELY